jgi:predicted component of type VI protein secretion system
MAYVIVYHKDEEITRLKLESAVTLGRSLECELSVHDILLSRRHCTIEPEGQEWVLRDLGSKNGTRVGGQLVSRLPLTDHDVIRMGKTSIRFRTSEFIEASAEKARAPRRPADPMEALAGTVFDFEAVPAARPPARVPAPNGIRMPTPKPAPREPMAYADDDVRSLVSQLMSSSWDSIYENAKRTEPSVQPDSLPVAPRRRRPKEPGAHLTLQVATGPAQQMLTAPLPPKPLNLRAAPLPPRPLSKAPRRKHRFAFLLKRIAMIFQWVPIGMLVWGIL